MSETFNFGRFLRFFRYDFKNAVANYGLTFLIIACAPIWMHIIYGAFSMTATMDHAWHGPGIEFRYSMFFVIGLVFFASFPAKVYGFITEKRAGGNYLLIPASTCEKFVSMLLNSLVVFPLAFILLYAGCDSLMAAADPTVNGHLSFHNIMLTVFNHDFDSEEIWLYYRSAAICLTSYLCSILIFLLGAICFRRRKVSNTILVLLGIGILLSLLIVWLANNVSMDVVFASESDAERYVRHAANTILALSVLEAAALGTAIFFRLKTIKH